MRTNHTHSGLQDGIKRFDLLEALDRAKGIFGLKPIDLAYMRLAFAKTRETDFKPGHVCGFWDNVASLADQLGINTRHLNRIETRLEQVGLIAKTTLSNRGRWGGRGADGNIEGLSGINLGPIINRAEEVLLAAQTQRNTQTRLKELRREVSDLIKRVRIVCNKQATALLSQIDKRLRPSEIQSVDRLQTIIEGLAAILREFGSNNSGQTKDTPRSDQNVRPYTHKQKPKNTCSVTIGQMKDLAAANFRDTLEFYDCQSWGDISQPASDYAQQVGISRTQWQRRCQEIGEPRAVLCLLVADRNASRTNEDRYKVRSIPKAFMGMARKEAIEEGVLISLISEIKTFSLNMSPVMRKQKEQRARLRMSYDTAPCEGRQASPSNPNQARGTHAETVLSETFVFRCTVSEKADLRAKAEAASLPSATLLREALGLVDAKRRKPIPRVDPKLTIAVARVGGNLNQLARWINRATISGHASSIDAVKVAVQLVTIERQLAAIIDAHSDHEAQP